MKVMRFPYDNFAAPVSLRTLENALQELFQRRLISMEGFSLSLRHSDGFLYLDTADAARVLWAEQATDPVALSQREPLQSLHQIMYDRVPVLNAIVTGRPPYSSAFMDSANPLAGTTSMLQKRGVNDVEAFSFPQESLGPDSFPDVLDAACRRAEEHGMAHLPLLIRHRMLICGAQNLFEAMTHYQNIEFCARLEYLQRVLTRRQTP